jgi:glycosyltransferase involved in cell wall biosynthesis
MLKTICEEENAGLFISTHYTSVEGIPSIMPVYDMIPEKTGSDLSTPTWVAKHLAIHRASAFFCMSQFTRKDLLEVFPDIDPASAVVTYSGVDHATFKRTAGDELSTLRNSLNLDRPYFILPSGRAANKNMPMFFEAMRTLPSKTGFKALVTGEFAEADLGGIATGCEIITSKLSNDELRTAYSGALAVVYTFSYEGFGLPILEAMACECPVICSPWGAIPEVGGSAVMYVKDAENLANALIEIQRPETRDMLIAAGNEQMRKFRWDTMAGQLQDVCEQVLRATEERITSSPQP